MKLSVLLAVTLVAFASVVSAAPMCVVGGTMASYVALGSSGCQIGDKLFSSFFYQPTFGGTVTAAVPASAVLLTPVDPNSTNPGIVFSSNWTVPGGSANSNSFFDASIGFTVTVQPGGNLIEDASLTLGDFLVVGAGTATIGETVLAADGFTVLGVLDVDAFGPLVDHVTFAPTRTVQVRKDFFVGIPRFGTGSVRVSDFTENFSEIPEPVGTVLIGSGLLALGIWRRRVSRG